MVPERNASQYPVVLGNDCTKCSTYWFGFSIKGVSNMRSQNILISGIWHTEESDIFFHCEADISIPRMVNDLSKIMANGCDMHFQVSQRETQAIKRKTTLLFHASYSLTLNFLHDYRLGSILV